MPRRSSRTFPLSLLTLLALGCGSREPHRASVDGRVVGAVSPAADSAAAFAQHFYDWYVRDTMAGFEAVVRDSGALFAPELLSALREDLAASAAHPDEIVGLDWDPFVASQDPCPVYLVGHPTERDGRVLVPVTGKCGERPAGAGPDVIAELVRQGPAWAFSNFRHGSDSGSVLSDLAQLKRERGEHR